MNEPAIILTEEQELACEALDEAKSTFVLKGYAGTGKSTLLAEWVKSLPPEKTVVLTAPTNKATNVLRDKAKEAQLRVDVSTIYSLLSLKLKWQEDQQIIVQDNRGDNLFADYDVVVVDETSMVNEELREYIQIAQEDAGNIVVYTGDPCQLPPVNESESLTFSDGGDNIAELKTIMRQAKGNPIMDLSLYLRYLILEHPTYPNKIYDFVDDKHIFHTPLTDHEEEILEAFAHPGDLDLRHVAWTNKVVNAWNDKIRDRIYGFDREDWTKGEQIVTTAPVIDNQENQVIFTTDTLLTVQRDPVQIDKKGVPCWRLTARGRRLYVIQNGAEKQYREEKNRLLNIAKQDRKKWRDFYDFIETFAQIRPAHSMTVHRSQGSTFDDVYVSLANILANPRRKESLQCLYVAITRPRRRLYLV